MRNFEHWGDIGVCLLFVEHYNWNETFVDCGGIDKTTSAFRWIDGRCIFTTKPTILLSLSTTAEV